MEQTAEEHALVARARAGKVNDLLCHLQDATMNGMRVVEEASQLRHQVTDLQAALRETGAREHANVMAAEQRVHQFAASNTEA
eukprot:10079931-Lingulodinium_polyedra.AAC.1